MTHVILSRVRRLDQFFCMQMGMMHSSILNLSRRPDSDCVNKTPKASLNLCNGRLFHSHVFARNELKLHIILKFFNIHSIR